MMRPLLLIVFLLFLPVSFVAPSFAESGVAENVYRERGHSVFQIAVIDKNSGEKSAIGSGFPVDSGNGGLLFVTNYHVVSDWVGEPDRYDLEYRHERGDKGSLSVVAIDVVRDLAVLTPDQPLSANFHVLGINLEPMAKGQKIFAMGNPHDLGMVIIEGTYNGLIENGFFSQMLLAGVSLNPGMSGGPAMDEQGRVVGVNVAIGGDDINYLIPAKFLAALLQRAQTQKDNHVNGKKEWQEIIAAQIRKHQALALESVIGTAWGQAEVDGLMIPKDVDSSLKCWGDTGREEPEKSSFTYAQISCNQDHRIFLSSRLYTGSVSYVATSLKSDGLSSIAFNNLYSRQYGNSYSHDKRKAKHDVTEFICQSGFFEEQGVAWKSAFCVRRYRDYEGLTDVFVSSAALGKVRKGYVVEFGLEGVPLADALRFSKKFMQAVQWKN